MSLSTTNRRVFLQGALAAGAGAALAGTLSQPSLASQPVQRNGTPKYKFSLAGYSYRDKLTGDSPELTLFEFIDDCARMQLEGTELTSYYFPNPVTHDYLRQLKQHCFRLGLDVSGTAVGNDFGHPPGPQRQQEIEHVKQWIRYAEILGAPVIRIFAGSRQQNTTPDQMHKLMVAGMEECCEYAGQHGVHLALENHGGPTSTVEGLLALVRDVKSPWFGVNLDTGNFHSDDIYGELAKVAPYTLNVQVKVTVSGPDGKKRPSDFQRLRAILEDAGYRGYIVLEYEESDDPRVACPEYVKQLREAFI